SPKLNIKGGGLRDLLSREDLKNILEALIEYKRASLYNILSNFRGSRNNRVSGNNGILRSIDLNSYSSKGNKLRNYLEEIKILVKIYKIKNKYFKIILGAYKATLTLQI
ncbi:hypothetical protein H105_09013, partial [Trichophyton soudanense CBS 452.61]